MFKIRPWFYWMVAGVVLIGTIVWLSCWGTQVSQDWATLQQNPTDASKKKFDASLEVVKAIVGGIGTVATIIGGFFVFRNVQLTQTRLTTERFSKAVEQLGSDKIEVRLGGIYALERIAQDSDRDHWTIMEVLTSFIQEKSPARIPSEKICARAEQIKQGNRGGTDEQNRNAAIEELESELTTKDIQAALTVIGRRHKKDPPDRRIDLNNVKLTYADFTYSYLSGADLNNANLHDADLSYANLHDANLHDTDLSYASLHDAHLSRVNFSRANLSRANLNHAKLNYASLHGADLSYANLNHANLNHANLNCADLSCANLYETDLSYADLSQIEGLTADRLEVAKLCQTKLPAGIALDPNRDCKALEG